MTKTCIGTISFDQRLIADANCIVKTYDLAISVLSWEQRAPHGFIKACPVENDVHCIWFESRSETHQERKQEQFDQLSASFTSVKKIELGLATETDHNFDALQSFFTNVAAEKRRPLKVLIDISCLPKSYLLFLIGFGFKNDVFACFDCLYSAGKYDLSDQVTTPEDEAGRVHRALISKGSWTSRRVPFLESQSVFPDSRDVLVAMGGEIGLAVPFVAKSEPIRSSFVFIEESAPAEHAGIPASEFKAYKELMEMPNATETTIGLVDAVGFAKHCNNIASICEAECLSIVVLGAKSHAVACGIVGLANDNVEVTCRVPTSYSDLDVEPTGALHIYEIEDRFEPLNYVI